MNNLIDHVIIILKYNWDDEKRDYHKLLRSDNKEMAGNHIFVSMRELRDAFGLKECFEDEYEYMDENYFTDEPIVEGEDDVEDLQFGIDEES